MAEASSRKNSEKSLKDAKMPPLPFEHQILKGDLPHEPEKEVTTLKEAEKKIKRMQKVVDDAQNRLDEVYRLTGWTHKTIEDYVTNPVNFTSAEWERLNQQRKETMDSLVSLQDAQKLEEKFNRAVERSEKTGGDSKLAKERRKKGAGMRRNWLPVR